MGAASPAQRPVPWAAAEAIGLAAAELAAFQDEPPQMASGAVGKTAFLRLGFERREERTILADLDRRAPYMAQRVLYPDPALPDLAWLFMITTSGCVLQGDRLALEIDVAAGARAHVTTQAATKIHGMDANYAVQTQTISVGEDAYLEFLPEPMIPHRRARFLSETRITVAPTATVLYGEIVQSGRKHHHPDESFGVTLLSLAVEAERPGGEALFSEKLLMEPARQPVRQAGVMGGFEVFANVVLLAPKAIADRVDARVGAEVDLAAGVAFGACRLPNDAGLIYKALGHETAEVRARVRDFWSVVREEATGSALTPPFFWR
jgi:urease accessory protein